MRQHPSEGVRGGIERRNPFRFPMQHRAAATCPRVCEVASSGRSLPKSVQGGVNRQQPARECARRRRAAESCSPVRGCASRRRAAAPGLRVCQAASSCDTLSEGGRGGVKRRHMVRGCSSGRREATPHSRVCKEASSGDTLSEGMLVAFERRYPVIGCEVAWNGNTLSEGKRGSVEGRHHVQECARRRRVATPPRLQPAAFLRAACPPADSNSPPAQGSPAASA